MRTKLIKLFKYLFIAFLLTIPVCALAADYNLKFAWTQEGTVDGWQLYMSQAVDGTYTPALDANGNPIKILVDSATNVNGEYQADQAFQITGDPGQAVIWHFKMASFKGTEVSVLSNSVSHEFTIPIVAPYILNITVSVVPK